MSQISSSSENEPLSGIISKIGVLEDTISNLELDVRNELTAQRLQNRCQLNLAAKCEDTPSDPSVLEYLNKYGSIKSSIGSAGLLNYAECNCRCNQALEIYLDQLRNARMEEEDLLAKLKMKEVQMQLYRTKLMEANAIVERQKQEIVSMKQNEEQVTARINIALEQENQTLMDEITRLKRLPEELLERERSLKLANKELQETKLTLKSLLLDIESGLEACEDISGELQQERKRAFQTMSDIDEEKRKVLNWVAKYTELKEQYESAAQQRESVMKLTAELRDKTVQLEQMTKEFNALKEESVGYISKVETQHSKQHKELQEQLLELECENLRLKVALEEQSTKTSDATHKMQQELFNLEQKFVEAQDDLRVLKHYNEAAAAAAEYGSRKKDDPEVDDSWLETQSMKSPFCSFCITDDVPELPVPDATGSNGNSSANTADVVANGADETCKRSVDNDSNNKVKSE